METKRFLFILLACTAVLVPGTAQSGRSGTADYVPQVISSIEGNGGKRYAVCIGINNYEDPQVSDLNKARNDAKSLGLALEEFGQFDSVFVLADDVSSRDQTGRYPRLRNINAQLDLLGGYVQPNDLVVFSFAGHGITSDGKSYLLPVDADYGNIQGTSLCVEDVLAWLDSLGVHKSLLILDACREELSEYVSRGLARERIGAERYHFAAISAIFYSTKTGWLSYEDVNSDHGIFTRFMLEGMRGKADYQFGDGDGIVTFREAARFLEEAVSNYALNRNWKQKPESVFNGEDFGDLALSTYGGRVNLAHRMIMTRSVGSGDKDYGSGTGTLRVYSNVDGTLLLDDEPKGEVTAGTVTSFERIAPGLHFVEIDHPYGRFRSETEVFGGKTTELTNQVILEEREIRRLEGINFVYVSGLAAMEGFWMAESEITLGQFARFIEDTGYEPDGNWDSYYKANFDYFPVSSVSKRDADAFARWLSERTGLDVSLPTMDQWVFAAGGKYNRKYPWGDSWDDTYCHNENFNPRGMVSVSGQRGSGDGPSLFQGYYPGRCYRYGR